MSLGPQGLAQRMAAMPESEIRRILGFLVESLPEAARLVNVMLDPDPARFFATVEVVKKRMGKRRGLTEAEFAQDLETIEREARLLPVESRPEAGLALTELGTLGYEFTNLLDFENELAVTEGPKIYAEACRTLGRTTEALAKLDELEETSNYGLDAREAKAVLLGKPEGGGRG